MGGLGCHGVSTNNLPCAPAGRSVFVSIVLYRPDICHLCWTLEGLRSQELRVTHVDLVLNAATESTVSQISSLCNEYLDDVAWELVIRRDNLGFTGGHNLSARRFLSGDFDVFVALNPDLQLEARAIKELSAVASASPCIVGPLLLRAESRPDGQVLRTSDIDTAGIYWTRSGRHLDSRAQVSIGTYEVEGVSGAALAISRVTAQRIFEYDGELFDEVFFAYREDAELGVRAAQYGIPSLIVGRALGWHVRTLRGTSRKVSRFHNLLSVQNRLILAVKLGRNRPGSLALQIARDILVLAASASIERSSWPGVRRAVAVRRYVWHSGRRVRKDKRRGQLQVD